MTRRERLEKKLERRRGWAGKARARSGASLDKATEIADRIPFGQPILVGHHSEKKARRDADRIHDSMTKGCEQQKLAAHHESKADGLERQLENTVFSDDDDAVEALEERMRKREAEAQHCKAVNAAFRKKTGTPEERLAALVEDEVLGSPEAERIARTFRLAPHVKAPYPTYVLTNLRSRIRSDKKRIEQIKARAAKSRRAEEAGGVLVARSGEYAVVTFAEKPEREVIKALKAAGFWWAGGSWNGKAADLPDVVREMVDGQEV